MTSNIYQSRSYVVGLPVELTVHDDGTVTAQVDLSEASELRDSSVGLDWTLEALPEAERQAVIDADEARIEHAVVQALVRVF